MRYSTKKYSCLILSPPMIFRGNENIIPLYNSGRSSIDSNVMVNHTIPAGCNMTFFLNENFPKKAVEILNNQGYAVIDIRGTDDCN